MTVATEGRRTTRVAAAAAFCGQGLVFISLTTRLPDLQHRFGLSPGTFSILMLALVLCAGVGSLVGEKLAPTRGSASSLRVGFAVMAGALPLMGSANAVWQLALGMAAYGLALGLVDAGTNMQGVAVEHDYGRPIMPTFHASWTLGGILGTLGALTTHGLSFEVSALVLAIVPLVLLFAPYLNAGGPITPIGDDGEPVPWRRILPVGAAMVLFYMVDTAITTWGPTYVDHVFAASAWVVSIATLPYLVASLAGRGAGDFLAGKYGNPPLVRAAAVVGAASLAIIVFAPSSAAAMGGFLLLGAGIAVIAPLSYSAAAAIARESVKHDDPIAVRAKIDAIIARFNQFNYVGGLLGAVLTGAVGDKNLRFGFAIPMVLILLIFPLAKSFR
ncbi:MFS transporter [Calidifontibacter terrae]